MQRHSRYVQASQYINELDDKLTSAREEISILKSKYADHHSEADRITYEIKTVTEQRDRLAKAATTLIAAKGRHNTMLAYNGLRDALQSLTPKNHE
jgi:chromosome segregation ATPase